MPERSLSCFSCIFSDAAVTSIPCRSCIPKKAAARLPKFISDTLQITMAQAEQLHLHMIIYTMGIASILATSCSHIPEEELMTQLETACDAFLAEIRRKNNE